ncbi:MAG: CocE/NonD family hydrolase [Candidatus Helarchaeota archaeon]
MKKFDYTKFMYDEKQVGLSTSNINIKLDSPLLSKTVDALYLPITTLLQGILGFGIPKNRVTRFKECLISLQDGAKLATDVYLPNKIYKNYLEKKRAGCKCSTILVRLPYFKNSVSIIGYSLASRGYATVIQDIRGTARSSHYGTNTIMLEDRHDGLETLKWITKRFWYNKKIGMWGASYFGQSQLAVSWDNDDLITCLNPGLCSYTSLAKHNGGLYSNELMAAFLEILYQISFSEVSFSDISKISRTGAEYVKKMFRSPYDRLYNEPLDVANYVPNLAQLRGKNFDEITKILNKIYQINLDFSKKDNGSLRKFLELAIYMRKLNLNTDYMPSNLNIDFSKINTPMLLIAGWYDLFLEQMIEDFRKIKQNAPKEAQKKIKLVIGPWGHADRGYPDLSVLGGLLSFVKEIFPIKWFDYWLKGKKYPILEQPPIWYYVLGKNIWRPSNNWPPSNVEYVKYFLHSEGKANSKFGNGKITLNEPRNELPDFYKFNPMNPVLTKGGRNLNVKIGGFDQTESEIREDVLVYTSEKLKKGLEMAGDVKIVLYASSSAVDTDFMVKLVDVYPNGKAINIIDDGIRARFRNGIDSPSLIEPDKIFKYEFNVGNISIFFRKDHRIRVDITSSNFPRFDINSNLGGKYNKKGFVVAFQKVFHNVEHPSHVIFPILLANKR